MKIPVDGKITHPELLILLKKKEENNIQKKRKQLDEKEKKICPFQPNIT